MKLRDEILREHSKIQCDKIVRWIGKSQEKFDQLFRLFLSEEYRVVQRAAWPVSFAVIAHPAFINKHWEELVKNLNQQNVHGAVKRNSVRLLQGLNIPEKFQGEIMNICFRYVESPTEAIAVKAFSLTVLGNLSKLYPEIIPELRLLIESQVENATPAFKIRAKKILKSFEN